MNIRALLESASTPGLPWLKDALQAAVELEFFTLPPYLTAMWSIKDENHVAADIIREVAYEEMQHMALACNMLAAIGGTPRINRPPSIPEYPRPMPGGVKPQLIIGLSGLTKAAVDVFMAIEEPEVIVPLPALEMIQETFPRIGAFYEAIQRAFHEVNPAINVERQITGPLAPMVVANLKDVENAISLIRVQGEGTNVSPAVDSPTHLAHYYLFKELKKERKLVYDPAAKTYQPTPMPFPDTYPVAPVPAGGYRYDEVKPQAAALLRQFDHAYTKLLDELQSAWTGSGQAALLRAAEWMFSLVGPARALMDIPIPGTNPPVTYGPNFRYLGTSD
jgi:hypothetical protein